MMAENPSLPTRFPCWVQAVYSWGGESKKDLGFMEGDLIECLNAGDGSWWMGRLRRDRRAVGLFPSNFVKVLDEDFSPVPRMSSTNQNESGSQSPAIATPQKAKFRGPFTAMAVNAPGAKDTPSPAGSVTKKSKNYMPYSSMKKDPQSAPAPKPVNTQPPAPRIPAPLPRGSSPMPGPDSNIPSRTPSWAPSYAPSRATSRAASPAPQQWSTHYASPLGQASRAVSPAPSGQSYFISNGPSRAASPLPPQHRAHSPLPPQHRAPSPLPPQHRGPSPSPSHYRQPSPQPVQQYQAYRNPSPAPSARSYRSVHPQNSHHDQDYDELEDNTVLYQSQEYTQDENYDSNAMDYQPEFDHGLAPSPQSSPPPPPPAHRVAYTRPGTPESTANHGYDDHSRNASRSPAPSERSRAMTPSPLRDAMNDVMSSLEGMSMSRKNSQIEPSVVPDPHPAEPVDMWSAEAFDEIYTTPRAQRPRLKTANSSRSLAHIEAETSRRMPQDGPFPIWSPTKQQPELESYVDRMEKRLSCAAPDNTYDFTAEDITSSPPAAPSISRMPGRSRSRASKHASTRSESHAVSSEDRELVLEHRKSAYELGKQKLKRTFSTKSTTTIASSAAQSTSTNTSSSTAMTSQSLMSGYSAGGFSATSAGSLARRTPGRSGSIKDKARSMFESRPGTSMSGISYHSSHASGSGGGSLAGQAMCQPIDPTSMTGFAPNGIKKKKSFVRSLLDKAKTSTATVRSTVSTGQPSRPSSPQSMFASGPAIGSESINGLNAAKEMGLGGGGNDWMQMRRDVNRSNSLSRNERNERVERCEMMDLPVLAPTEAIQDVEGDEAADGYAVHQAVDFSASNLAQVDKNTRFISNLPGTINAISLAQGYLCRPYRSEVQRLRAIFTWVSERIAWEEDFEDAIDTRRVIQARRACSKEIAILVSEMCDSLGIQAEVVNGYLKAPGEALSRDHHDATSRPNHWWNAVIVEGEWRIMDCSLASPSHPRRTQYSSSSGQAAETFWFLTRPSEACYTHVPSVPEQQHIVPLLPASILLALPVAGPATFKHNLRLWDFDTSLLHLDNLEMAHIQLLVPETVELTAETESRVFARDADGDFFESGDILRSRALAQAEFVTLNGSTAILKRYTIRALVPPSASAATLKVYAGRRGLMHSIQNNPHPFALALPLSHSGLNPEYEFFTRHPTPHALRHELYVVSPLCKGIVCNNTVVFSVRQHPASSTVTPQQAQEVGADTSRAQSAMSTRPGLSRPISSLSIASVSASGSAYSDTLTPGVDAGIALSKPAKLAVQTPGGRIIRMTRKLDPVGRGRAGGGRLQQEKESEEGCVRLGSTWETVVKVGERGTWRGLVLADRSARWCVFGEWVCT